ncbi:MAG TPA: hypothetical protein VNT33_11575 [Telluria sp.]|nr:hypothetical protein [Telluria sp.]
MKRQAALLACLLAASAQAQEDLDALKLADEAPAVVEQRSDWRSFVEAGLGRFVRRGDGSVQASRRLSLDVQYEHALSQQWSVAFADRIDTSWLPDGGGRHSINTLKEAYASWRPLDDAMLDIGRVNVRNGVALGYNPTDWFRRNAVRSVVSIDPASLKQNREGADMLRAQKLWNGGSLTALTARDPGRVLVAVTQKIGGLSPQVLAYREQSQPVQLGLNLTGLVNDATVAFVEWAGGRAPSQLGDTGERWRDRLATGLTYTTTSKLSLTGEFHYNGAAADEAAWDRLRAGPPLAYAIYRTRVQQAQDLPTRRELFFHGLWQDALMPQLDLAAMHSTDLVDRSRRVWLELRYHAGRTDFALQWQRSDGRYLSNFGALPEARGWQWTIRHYF